MTIKVFHSMVKSASKLDQTISHLSQIECNAHSIWLHVDRPDLMRIRSVSKGAPYNLQTSRAKHGHCAKTKPSVILGLWK